MLLKLKNILNFIFSIISFFTSSLKVKTIFFFPFYHTGGAERVHLDIVKSLGKKNSIVIFTAYSTNRHFLEDFQEFAYCFDFKPFLKNMYYKKIIHFFFSTIGLLNNLSVFGCNSRYFYDILPFINNRVKKIDLLHAFTLPDKGGMEIYSLSNISLLDKRVVINKRTKNDFIKLYKEYNINEKEVDKIEVITNAIEIPNKLFNKKNDILNIIYVGRIAREKRVNIIIEIGKKIKNSINLSIYGHKEISLPDLDFFYKSNIEDKELLNKIYNNANILLISSYREGFPMVIMEAMARGVVCISTDVGGINEHIINGYNGYLISNNQSEKEIINDFLIIINELNLNRELLDNISENAFSYAQENFSFDKFNTHYQTLLK